MTTQQNDAMRAAEDIRFELVSLTWPDRAEDMSVKQMLEVIQKAHTLAGDLKAALASQPVVPEWQPEEKWHEDHGNVLWVASDFHLTHDIYFGSPLDENFDDNWSINEREGGLFWKTIGCPAADHETTND